MIFWLLFFFYHFENSKLERLSFSIVVLMWVVKCVSFLVCLILVCVVAKNVRIRPQVCSILSVLSLSHTFLCGWNFMALELIPSFSVSLLPFSLNSDWKQTGSGPFLWWRLIIRHTCSWKRSVGLALLIVGCEWVFLLIVWCEYIFGLIAGWEWIFYLSIQRLIRSCMILLRKISAKKYWSID